MTDSASLISEDLVILQFAGYLGHAVAGVTGSPGSPGSRRLACQTNTIEAAKRLCARDLTLRVYTRDERGQWLFSWKAR